MAVINLRDFPEELHKELKIRAAEEGTTIRALVIRYCGEGIKRGKKKAK